MNQDIVVKKLSGHSNSGKIGKIHKRKGDKLACGDLLATIESEKGTVKLTSEVLGTLVDWFVEEGDSIQKGQIVGRTEGSLNKDAESGSSSLSPGKGYSFGLAKPKKEEYSIDVVIVGGGPGGYVAAIRAAQQEKSVLIVEEDRLGGTCLNWGCIPTKALIASAELLEKIRNAQDFGLHVQEVQVDLPRIMERKDQVVQSLVGGIEYLMETHGIIHINGKAEVRDQKTLTVRNQKIDATITFNNLIIATGSKPYRLPISGGENPEILDNRGLLSLKEIPESLTIIGGGVIGMEFAFLYQSLGSKVHVIEYLPQILNILDEEVIQVIRESAKEKGICLYEGAKAMSIQTGLDGRKIVAIEKNGETSYLTSQYVAMAVGRVPNVESLDLEMLGVKLKHVGKGIEVDHTMRTSNPKIFAIGDVTNMIQLAHVASHQGMVAADVICGKQASMDYHCIPSAIFTSPSIGQVGLTEKIAQEQQIPIIKGNFPFAANGKAQSIGETDGFVQLIAHKDTREILGGSIVGAHATDLISVIANFVASKTTIDQASHVVYAHPTTAESIHEALLTVDNRGIHFA